MTQDIVKEGFELAEQEAREKQVREVKEIVTKTLEKLEGVQKEIGTLKEEERILKMDIADLKVGKIDRIVERQEKDPKAKDVSVVVIIKEKEVVREVNPWYWPYQVIWHEPYLPAWHQPAIPYCGTVGETSGMGSTLTTNAVGPMTTINCSVAKDAAIGAYEINGHMVHLR